MKRKIQKPKFKIEMPKVIERCCCGSGMEAELEYNNEGKACGYFCPECRDIRLKTFGIDTTKKRSWTYEDGRTG